MLRNYAHTALLAILIFFVTNLLAPELFQDTIFARIADYFKYNVEYRDYHLLIEPGSGDCNKAVFDQIAEKIVDHSYAWDFTGKLFTDDAIMEALRRGKLIEKVFHYVRYDPYKIRPGNRLIKVKIYPRDLYGDFPIEFEILQLEKNHEMTQIMKPGRLYLSPKRKMDDTIRVTADFIIEATAF
ncbi:MAG: hypothetical protein Kow0029_31410 [Candidatus Rifleibacteriota bacterium]